MWLFTVDGFFSAVKDHEFCGEDELMIRARCRQDLERMLKRLYGAQYERLKLGDGIIELDHADYRYRYKLPRQDWVIYVADAADKIIYPTVKDNINPHDRRHNLRHKALYSIWHALSHMQEDIIKSDKPTDTVITGQARGRRGK